MSCYGSTLYPICFKLFNSDSIIDFKPEIKPEDIVDVKLSDGIWKIKIIDYIGNNLYHGICIKKIGVKALKEQEILDLEICQETIKWLLFQLYNKPKLQKQLINILQEIIINE
jgi:hypothetical protein